MTENKFISMRTIAYDTVSIKPDSVIYKLFVDDDASMDQRVNTLFERELVKFLFNPVYRFFEYLIFEELGITNTYSPHFEKIKPIIDNPNEKPGDIDLLLVDKSQVIKSIGFQVKKLKGFVDLDNTNKVKFSNIEEGIVQVNKMFEKYRFYKNYLMLIVANYGRNNTTNNFFFRHVGGSEIKPLYSISTYEKLREEIGIFIIEITQPISKGITKSGEIASKLFKDSTLNIQSEEITNKIKLLIDES